MNVEAQVTWTDGERFVTNASSGPPVEFQSPTLTIHFFAGSRANLDAYVAIFAEFTS
jgi:hypothetical protein